MDIFGKYRLERIVVAQGGVTIWDATDLHCGRRVQLSIFANASTMLDHGRIENGTFVVVDGPAEGGTSQTKTDGPAEGGTSQTKTDGPAEGGTSQTKTDGPAEAPKLELVEISDEDAFFDEPPPPELFDDAPASPPPRAKRGWFLSTAILAGALVGAGGLYVSRTRPAPTSEVTITAAPLPVTVTKIETPLVAPQPTTAPSAAPTSPPTPKRHKPVRAAPRPRPPHVTTSDPLTL